LAGQGLQDTTRVAAGDPVLWEEIFGQNRDALLSALESFEKTCGQLREALGERRDDEIRNWLAAGKKYRDELN
jgi:prephenate dehydrogenase